MIQSDPEIPIVDTSLQVTVADGEIVLETAHDMASLTPAAAEETARQLVAAAHRPKDVG